MVSLVGAGPGRADLITLAGLRRLQRADVVVYDRLIDPRLLDRAPAKAERIFAGKRCGEHVGLNQSDINALLIEKALAGKRVVRLKGGDPLLFARGSEEAEALEAAGVEYEIVPGVTAANAAAACASIPLTHRELSSAVAWFTGHEAASKRDPLEWSRLAEFPGTLVAYMGVTRLKAICAALLGAGKSSATPVAIVEWGGVNCQQVDIGTLSEFAEDRVCELGSPALVIVGPVVELRKRLGWFERRPLFGKTVLATRPAGQVQATVDRLEELGANVLVQPVVAIEPLRNFAELDATLARLRDFDWLAFTSPNGVDHFLSRLFEVGDDLRRLGHLKLAAIGPGTAAALERFHLRADLMPDEFRSEALAETLKEHVAGLRVLLARANRGRTILEDELAQVAARVERLTVYRQFDVERPSDEIANRLREGKVDWVLLTSTNIAAGFLRWMSADAELESTMRRSCKLASISPVTSAAIRAAGFVTSVEASIHTPDGLIDALLATCSPHAPP